MAIGRFLKTGSLAVLAAGLALAAVPAAAQDGQGRGGWRGGDRGGQAQSNESGRSRGGWNGGERRGGGEARQSRGSSEGGAPAWRGRQQSAPQAVAPQAAPEQRRSWQGRGAENRGEGRRGWRADNAQRQVDVPRNGVEQRQAQARQAARENGWNGRNRSYVDPNRSNTYRGADRRDDGRRDWQRGGNDRRDWQRDNNRNDRRWDNNGRNDRRWDNDRRDNRRWNNAWRNDSRYDWQRYRYSNRNVYRIGRYYAPYRNYYYRPLSIGFRLDSLFFGSSYWINDPWQYRLPPAYDGYRWVRYYDDVLLVDIYTGEVVDVIRDFFW